MVVYQAYNHQIADAAVDAQSFVAPFSFKRMTWIKPSFLWMMERSGWASKSNQERILAIRLSRLDWEKVLRAAVLTSPQDGQCADDWRREFELAPTRVQWDPERTLRGKKSDQRSIQVGIGRDWVDDYAKKWVLSVTDVTPLVHKIQRLRSSGSWSKAKALLPKEEHYPTPRDIAQKLGME